MIIINGVNYGNATSVSVMNGKVVIDGRDADVGKEQKEISIVINGELKELKCDSSVTVKHGNVGMISAGGSVTAADVGGSVSAGGSVRCSKVLGNVMAGGSVRMG